MVADDRPDAASALIITRLFDAPRELVFRAWSEPRYLVRWWGPCGYTVPFCETDFRVGGRFLFCMRSPEGKDYWNAGVYREIHAPSQIVNTMHFSDREGRIVEPETYGMAGFPREMLDIVTFEDDGRGRTRLTLRRDHSAAVAHRFGEERGWKESLQRLAEALVSAEEEVR